jgi:hypothetical protein
LIAERRALLLAGVAAIGLGCVEPVDIDRGLDVTIELNPDVDLARYTSFAVLDPVQILATAPPPEYAALAAEIDAAIIAELTSKGLVYVPDGLDGPDEPDLLVNPLVSVARATNAASFYTAYWGWYYDYQARWTLVWDYPVGSLMLDIVDPRDRDDTADDVLVYRGVARGLLAGDTDVLGLELRNATRALFADWPDEL